MRRFRPAIIGALFNTALTVSGYTNLTVAVILWLLMIPLAGYAVWPWVRRRLGMSKRGNAQEPEESRGRGDYRSVTSHGQKGGQTAWSITNEGPQPRRIHRAAGDALVNELRKHSPERFQISWMMDAESGDLGEVLQQLLEQGGWQMTRQIAGAMLSGGPPRGVIVETTVDSDAVKAFIEWLRGAGLNPRVNKGESVLGGLAWGFGDSPPPPVHVVVGVLPQKSG